MTNGEVLQKTFPNSELETLSTKIVFTLEPRTLGQQVFVFDKDWWNAEYKEPTTKNNLGVDAVSRQEVLYLIADNDLSMGQVVRGIHALPSVTPQEPRWIPVSERMPEEDVDVLVTLEYGLIGIMQKKLADDDNGEPCYIWQDFEGEEHEVIAWMPLPQAYREVEE